MLLGNIHISQHSFSHVGLSNIYTKVKQTKDRNKRTTQACSQLWVGSYGQTSEKNWEVSNLQIFGGNQGTLSHHQLMFSNGLETNVTGNVG